MSKKQSAGGKIQWTRMLKKLSPYTIQKGFRYLKHYGPKEFWIRLHERFEPEEIPYGPWYAAYIPDKETLEAQKKQKFAWSPLISIAVPAYQTPVEFLRQMIESLIAQTYGEWELCIANASPDNEEMQRVLVKRVIGLPGETVSFRDGYTYIDGQKLDESYLPTQGITQCANTFAVPEGCIFVMGDNRTGSNDSRFLSQPYIPVDAIQGHMLAAISIGSQQSWQGVRWIG